MLDLLGPNLDDVLVYCGNSFSFRTTAFLGIQMLNIIEKLHNCDYLHRDIKPENFLLSPDLKNVYLIDFGLSKRFRFKKKKSHIPFANDIGLTGTMRYASINTHLGIEQSRRDDLESFLYVLVYFMKGCLPWQGIFAKTREEKLELVTEHKMSIRIEDLCEGLPSIFHMVLYT